MADTKLKVEKIDGRPFTIYVTEDGSFAAADQEGDRLTSPNLKSLIERLRKGLRTHGRVKIPATLIEEHWRHDNKLEITDVDLVGIHGGNNNVLYRKGKTTEQARYSSELYRRLTDKEVAELKALKKAAVDAQQRFEDYKDARKIDARAEIEKAQKSVIGEEESA